MRNLVHPFGQGQDILLRELCDKERHTPFAGEAIVNLPRPVVIYFLQREETFRAIQKNKTSFFAMHVLIRHLWQVHVCLAFFLRCVGGASHQLCLCGGGERSGRADMTICEALVEVDGMSLDA